MVIINMTRHGKVRVLIGSKANSRNVFHMSMLDVTGCEIHITKRGEEVRKMKEKKEKKKKET